MIMARLMPDGHVLLCATTVVIGLQGRSRGGEEERQNRRKGAYALRQGKGPWRSLNVSGLDRPNWIQFVPIRAP